MDLIYTNTDREDVSVLLDYDFDLAFGEDENNFELNINTNQHCCQAGCLLYIEGTEYGGIIDGMKISTKNDELTYSGRTWHGILASKTILPLLSSDESSGGVVVHKGGKNLIDSNFRQGFVRCTGTYESGSATLTRNATNGNTSLVMDYNNLGIGNTYTISAKGVSSNSANCYIQAYYMFSDGTNELIGTIIGSDPSLSIILEKECEYIRIAFGLIGASTATGVVVTFTEMQLEVGDTATSYKPYESLENEYLMLSGEANKVIGWLLDRIGLSDLFTASTEDSGLTIKNYKMNRYVDAYTGIMKMLASVSGKLQFKFTEGQIVLSALPIVDYSQDEQFDNDQTEMEVVKTFNPVNHLICLGSGELTERQVVHLYVDAEGNIGNTQTFTGLDEVVDVYDYANAESLDDLVQGGMDRLKELATADSAKMDFDAESTVYEIGDIVGAKEIITGIAVKEKITKKIVTINKGKINIEYKVGE